MLLEYSLEIIHFLKNSSNLFSHQTNVLSSLDTRLLLSSCQVYISKCIFKNYSKVSANGKRDSGSESVDDREGGNPHLTHPPDCNNFEVIAATEHNNDFLARELLIHQGGV